MRDKPSQILALHDFAVWMLILASFSPVLRAQDDENSLGDVARQSRMAHSSAPDQTSDAGATASHWAARIQERQEEIGTSPDGFETYVGPGYQLWIPAPFSVIGRNDAGTLLGSSGIADLTTKVFVGAPVSAPGNLNDLAFNTWANEFWRNYGSLSCSHKKTGSPYRDCSAVVTLLGFEGFGSARFVEKGDDLLPVVCFATREQLEKIDSGWPRSRQEQLEMGAKQQRNNRSQQRVETSGKVCATVLDSILLRGPEQAAAAHPHLRTTDALTTGDSHAEPPSNLGDVARASRAKAQTEKVKWSIQEQETASLAPPGFHAHSGQRCANECWEESFSLPEGARRVNGGKSDDVYVSTRGDLTQAVFYFAVSAVDYDYSEVGESQQLARQWLHSTVDPKLWPERVSRSINGQNALVFRTRLIANLNAWTEEQAVITTAHFRMRIGCILPEEHFIDNEWKCSTIFESWQMHP
jgi:hypothetical protein